jgi:hypothetical protein
MAACSLPQKDDRTPAKIPQLLTLSTSIYEILEIAVDFGETLRNQLENETGDQLLFSAARLLHPRQPPSIFPIVAALGVILARSIRFNISTQIPARRASLACEM